MKGGEGQRERERERERERRERERILSRLRIVSMEPRVRLDPRKREIMT